ncbi:MAG TPA: hypothetical protein VFU02_08695, partial [Polyangiaceae bacterium]|nr:hypothetical protein [Polyangiaceae bacterium]
MGWLRDLMEASAPPFRSFGALARRALESPDWPAGTAPQARSLAALFSKLDRRIELEWLSDRPDVQRVLAQCLGRPLAEITAVLGPSASPLADTTSRFRFEDAPYVRPLDLLHEGLCPGFPPDLTLPGTWTRLWWHAPPGSGRGLVGAWLEARGLCHVVRGATLESVLADVPAHGPVWLEVDEADAAQLAALDARGARSSLCIACRQAPAAERDFRVVAAPAPLAVLDEFVAWIAPRLPADGHFDAVTARRWLRNVADTGAVESLGTLLGLCGALDEIDPKK